MSQCDEILEALNHGWPVTPWTALHDFGCFRLAARIHDLRNKGHIIEMDQSAGYAEYWIEPENRPKIKSRRTTD